jgi:hypothetical protein
MMEQGRYRARAIQAGLGETSTGKEQVAVEFETVNEDGSPGEHITWFGFFTEKSLEHTVKALRACGWRGDDLTNPEGIGDNEVAIVVEHEEYNGEVRAKVKWVNAPGSGLGLKTTLDSGRAASFAAQMRNRIRAIEAGTGARKPAQQQTRSQSQRQEPPPHDDSDNIPF